MKAPVHARNRPDPHSADPAWLFREAWVTLSWLASLYKKVFRIAPFSATVSVILQIVSNISAIISFFLPLKVVILVGSERTPWYIRELFGDFDRDALIVGLTIGAVGFYLLHLLADHLAGRAIERGATALLTRASKMTMFEDQDKLGRTYFTRLSGALAALVFVGLALAAGFWIDPISFTVLASVLVVSWLTTAAICTWRNGRDWLAARLQGYLRILSGVAFLAFFCALLVQFLMGTLVNVIFAIVALLLARQMAQRVLTVVTNAVGLRNSETKVNSLFFFANPFPPTPSGRHQVFRTLLTREQRNGWLKAVLGEVLGRTIPEVTSYWRQIGIANVVALDVEARVAPDAEATGYLVKVYGPGRGATERHEAALLSEAWSRDLPAPRLLGMVPVDQFRALIFAGAQGLAPTRKQLRKAPARLMLHSWSVEPPPGLVDQYRRSKPILSERLKPDLTNDLFNAVNSREEEATLREFAERLPEIVGKVQGLPLFVFNPDQGSNALVTPDGTLVELNWARWAMEPVGAGWPPARAEVSQLADLLAKAAEDRPALHGVRPEDVALAAYAYVFERHHRRQNYRSAIELLPQILRCLDPAMNPTTDAAVAAPARSY